MKTIRIIAILFCIVLYNQTIAQNGSVQINNLLKKVASEIDALNYDQARLLAKRAENQYQRKQLDTINIKIYNSIAKTYLEKANLDSTYHYLNLIKRKIDSRLSQSEVFAPTLTMYGRYYTMLKDYSKALEYHKKSIELRVKTQGKNHPKVAWEFLHLGQVYFLMHNLKESEDNITKATQLAERNKENMGSAKKMMRNLLFFYYKKGQIDLAIKYGEKELKLAKELFSIESPEVALVYDNLAGLYFINQNYDKNLTYLNTSVNIYKSLKNDFRVAKTYKAIGVTYRATNQFFRCIKYFQKALSNLESDYEKNISDIAHSYLGIGSAYSSLYQKDTALDYLNKAKKMAQEFNLKTIEFQTDLVLFKLLDPIKDYEQIISICTNAKKIYESQNSYYGILYCNNFITKTHLQNKNYLKAIEYANQSIEIGEKYFPDPVYFNAPSHLSRIYTEMGKLQLAKKYLNQTAKLFNEYKKNSPEKFYNIGTLSLFNGYQDAKKNYYTLKYEKTKNEAFLDSIDLGINNYLNIVDHINKLKSTNQDSEGAIISNPRFYLPYVDFYLDYENQNLETAFKISEKAKTQRLKSSVNRSMASKFGKIPDSLLAKEKELQRSLTKFEKLKFESKNDSLTQSYTDKIFDLKKEINNLYDIYIKDYPNYHNIKYNNNVIDIAAIQKKLSPNHTLVEYLLGNDNIYMFTISKKSYKVKRIKAPKNLSLWVTQLRSSIYVYDDEKQTHTYLESAHNLYNTLIAPIKKHLKHQLIIIPDGILNYIPFETLLEKEVNQITSYKDLPYLIKKHQISYNYSATLYHQLLSQKSESAKENLVAFAPSFKDNRQKFKDITERRNGFENLLYNIPEAEMAYEYISGNLFKGAAATEENFLKNAGNYKIIHLSTHAKSNDKLGKYSFIAMSKVNDSINDANRIYTSELYNLDLKADMVVLSACETGLGELKQGEGIISLARAFTYAGAKSTINSLWSVNDASTKTLMETFYKNIKAGKTKDQALHEAKLSYLENEDMDAPYFWASFIAMGNMEPIALSSGFNYWWLLLLPVVFGIIYFVKRRR